MPKIFNKDTIDPETLSDGALRRILLDDRIASNDNIRLDHWDLGPGVPCHYPLRGRYYLASGVGRNGPAFRLGRHSHTWQPASNISAWRL